MAPMVGTTPNHRYEIEALAGKGGMGSVYLAEDVLLGRKVAVKLLADDTLGAEGRRGNAPLSIRAGR
jgi:serine/threonine protein kinase